MSVVVCDTTPLNYLILIGSIEILPQLFGTLLVPPAVITEMQHPRAPRAVAAWAHALPKWVEVRLPKTDRQLGIGPGEDEAIALAMELDNAALLIDDRKARIVAENHGLLTIGTIAVLDLADEAGLLDFESAISRLKETTFHVEANFINAITEKVRARKGNSETEKKS